jgi:hypothetical protein
MHSRNTASGTEMQHVAYDYAARMLKYADVC